MASNTSTINVPPGMKNSLVIGSGRYHCQSLSPTYDFLPENIDLNSPMLKYLRSGSPITGKMQSSEGLWNSPVIDASKHRHSYQYSRRSASGNSNLFSRPSMPVMSPLSAVENIMEWSSPSKVYGTTPVKAVEGEEVFVMDAVSVSGGGRSRKSTPDSYASSSSSAKSPYRTEICRSWEDSGRCRFGSKCQFAHGKEDLRPPRFNTKNKTEAQMCRSITSPGSSTPSPKPCLVPQMMAPKDKEVSVTKASKALNSTPPTTTTRSLTTSIPIKEEWSPQDDGIDVILPHSSSEKLASKTKSNVNAYIDDILYGSSTRKRLPVFVKICSE